MTPVGLFGAPGEMFYFQKSSGIRPKSKFSSGETMKISWDDMKIQRGELTNILRWLKITFSLQKLWPSSLFGTQPQ